jgi:hypothetical protein
MLASGLLDVVDVAVVKRIVFDDYAGDGHGITPIDFCGILLV